jgi:hypothetical protein
VLVPEQVQVPEPVLGPERALGPEQVPVPERVAVSHHLDWPRNRRQGPHRPPVCHELHS